MEPKALSDALYELADVAACIGGDFHTLHLNIEDAEADYMHRKVLKKYYEECDNDYDDLAEWGRCLHSPAPNKNESGKRINYQSWSGNCDKQLAAEMGNVLIKNLLNQYKELFNILNKQDDELSIGIANWTQTRIEYWVKELNFFNYMRGGK